MNSGGEVHHDLAQIAAKLDHLERRMASLEASATVNMTTITAMVRDAVRQVISEERLVADAQRFRSILGTTRKVLLATLLAIAASGAGLILNGLFL